MNYVDEKKKEDEELKSKKIKSEKRFGMKKKR